MRCVMVMYDSLNRRMLPPYNPETFVHAPNFQRLAERSVAFDTSYVCSMPCMPARRELHTGRPNFLHCGWGPLEPFDDSVPADAPRRASARTSTPTITTTGRTAGRRITTVTARGGSSAGKRATRSSGRSPSRRCRRTSTARAGAADWVNRQFIRRDEQYSQTHTFASGLDFIERNKDDDNWFLQIETFDPHEPFTTDRRWRDLYPRDPAGTPLHDWPGYGKVQCNDAELEAARRNYAALTSKCDASLGDVLDAFDRHNLWEDTMLIVWTDHGFMLGEHGWMAKNVPPLYDEIGHTPLFIWDPRTRHAGERRSSLVQPSIDLPVTLLSYFGLAPTEHMLGKDLAPVLESDTPVREAAIFGYFGSDVNVTDGRYVYMRAPEPGAAAPMYTLMPNMMRGWKTGLDQAKLHDPLPFTKDMPVLELARQAGPAARDDDQPRHLLFDTHSDPAQNTPLDDPAVEQRMIDHIARLMAECDATPEHFARIGVTQPG